ncbi:MAG: DNA polymerase III subunit chi [Gammaproteobacteria bacterium]|nr:DNA polymerase III subunit chi [Gammaproteobacteria bacterium]
MPRADFYILPEQGDREKFSCELASKIRRQELDIHIHTASRDEAKKLDTMLWTFKDTSFLPHTMLEDDKGVSQLTIGWNDNIGTSKSVLINLSSSIPQFADAFERVVEIVPAQESSRQQARLHYKHYRDAGFDMHNHDLNSGYGSD